MRDFVVRTPLIRDPSNIYLKAENLQTLKSYKIRGVASAIETAPLEKLRNGIRAASAGNMGQSVAFAAQHLEVTCEIYVPDSAPEVKKQRIESFGAKLIERPFEDIWEMVRTPPPTNEGLFVHPVFTSGLIEGYGKIVDEMLEDQPSLNAFVIPFGVGGLTLGLVKRLKVIKPAALIYTCETEAAAPLKASLIAGRPVRVIRHSSFVDAIGTPEVLPEVFSAIGNSVTDSLVVSAKNAGQGLAGLLRYHNMICEGAAAVSYAASLTLKMQKPELEVGCILTGANIQPEIFQQIVALSSS